MASGETWVRELPDCFRRPLHERIQEYIDSLSGDSGPWMADLRVSTPGDGRDFWPGRLTDFRVSVDRDLETRDDLEDAARMYLDAHRASTWSATARADEREPEPDHEEIARLPKGCLVCGEEDLQVQVTWENDEIERTRLRCQECGWTVTGEGPVRYDDKVRLERPDDEVDWGF